MNLTLTLVLLVGVSLATPDIFGSDVLSGSGALNPLISWGLANRALLLPVSITDTITVRVMAWQNGATISGNVDIGIYDDAFNRLASLGGATPQAGPSAVQVGDIPDTTLAPGNYYFAMACDNSAATFAISDFSRPPSALALSRLNGMLSATSSFPLPPVIIAPAPSMGYRPEMKAAQTTTAIMP